MISPKSFFNNRIVNIEKMNCFYLNEMNINNLNGSRNIYVTNDGIDEDLLVLPVNFNSEQFESVAIHPS